MDLDISLQLPNLREVVEGNSLKKKWIMGVCDLNFLLVYVALRLPHYHYPWNLQVNVSLFQPPGKHYTYRG